MQGEREQVTSLRKQHFEHDIMTRCGQRNACVAVLSVLLPSEKHLLAGLIVAIAML